MPDTRQFGTRSLRIALHRAALAIALFAVVAGCQPTAKIASRGDHATTLAQGVALLRSGRFNDAFALFNATSPFSTRNADTLSGLAIAADMTERRAVARRAYEALSTVAINRASFHNNRGYSRMLNGQLQAAFSDLTQAATLAPDNVKIRNNLRMLRAVLPRRGE